MRKIAPILLFSSALALSACDQTTRQFMDPDHTFASLPQPDVKGINDTQEESAKRAFEAGDYRRAGEFYEQLIDSRKGSPAQMLRYKVGMAEVTRRLGDVEHALPMYDQLARENPDNLDVKEGLGLTQMAANKPVDAGRTFAEIMEKDSKRWRTLNALGILFVTKNMIPEALAYYTEALKYSPDNPAILNNVGLSQAVDRQFPRAIESLTQASRLAKSPLQRKQIDLNLAMVYGVSGDLDTARDIASKHLEGPALDNNLGLYAHLAQDDNLAKTYLNMALSQSQSYYERAWNNLEAIGAPGSGSEVTTPVPAGN